MLGFYFPDWLPPPQWVTILILRSDLFLFCYHMALFSSLSSSMGRILVCPHMIRSLCLRRAKPIRHNCRHWFQVQMIDLNVVVFRLLLPHCNRRQFIHGSLRFHWLICWFHQLKWTGMTFGCFCWWTIDFKDDSIGVVFISAQSTPSSSALSSVPSSSLTTLERDF